MPSSWLGGPQVQHVQLPWFFGHEPLVLSNFLFQILDLSSDLIESMFACSLAMNTMAVLIPSTDVLQLMTRFFPRG